MALDNNGLEFLQNGILFVGLVDFGIAFFGDDKKITLGHTGEFTLYIARVLLDEFGESASVGLEIWVFSKNNNDFATHSG